MNIRHGASEGVAEKGVVRLYFHSLAYRTRYSVRPDKCQEKKGAGVKKPTTQRMSRQMFLQQSPNGDPHSCQEKKRAQREERTSEKSEGKK